MPRMLSRFAPILAAVLAILPGNPLSAQAVARATAAPTWPNAYRLNLRFEALRGTPSSKVYLWKQFGQRPVRVDSATYAETGIVLKAHHPGQYKVGFNAAEAQSFYLGTDAKLDLVLRTDAETGQTVLDWKGPEREAYNMFLKARKRFEEGYQEATGRYGLKMENGGHDSLRKKWMDQLVHETDSIALAYNRALQDLMNAAANTYTGHYLARTAWAVVPNRNAPVDMQRNFRKNFYFSQMDWRDTLYLFNDFLPTKLTSFWQEFGAQGEEGFREGTDALMKLAEGTPAAQDFVVNFAIETFGLRGPDAMVEYIRTTYLPRARSLSPNAQRVLARTEKLKPGKPAPNVQLPDTAGNMKRLRDNLGSRLTLLYIWSSTCSHCLEATPAVHDLVLKYAPKGMAAFAVALDPDPEEWKAALRRMNLKWTNVTDPRTWESPVVAEYGVRKTPFLALVDGQGNLLHVDLAPRDLPQVLANIFE